MKRLQGLDLFNYLNKKGMETEEGLAQKSKTQIFLMRVLCFSLTELLVSGFFAFNKSCMDFLHFQSS